MTTATGGFESTAVRWESERNQFPSAIKAEGTQNMPTEQDYRLQPESGPLSKVICNRCNREVGEVYTATRTPTRVKAGQSDEDVTLQARDLIREHLAQEHQGEPDEVASYENSSPRRPPEQAEMKRG